MTDKLSNKSSATYAFSKLIVPMVYHVLGQVDNQTVRDFITVVKNLVIEDESVEIPLQISPENYSEEDISEDEVMVTDVFSQINSYDEALKVVSTLNNMQGMILRHLSI